MHKQAQCNSGEAESSGRPWIKVGSHLPWPVNKLENHAKTQLILGANNEVILFYFISLSGPHAWLSLWVYICDINSSVAQHSKSFIVLPAKVLTKGAHPCLLVLYSAFKD